MPNFHDPDISIMKLTEEEKNGLQVYRNYSRAFEDHRSKLFSEAASDYPEAIASLSEVLDLIASEEPRSVLVIACAYADDLLKEMFRREIPDGVPGGRSELLSGFGPLSRLSQRVQMAYAFGWLSQDLLIELDHLRKMRNEISHKWDMKLLNAKLSQLIEQRQHRIEEYLGDGVRLPKSFHEALNEQQKLRVRLIWLLGRLAYESHLWVAALKENLSPSKVLYGSNPPSMLSKVSAVCVEVTITKVVRENG
jgi:hypothetical protein